jgi:deoxyribonuclease V
MTDPADIGRASMSISREELIAIQDQLGKACPEAWRMSDAMRSVAGCFICYPKKHEGKGAAGDRCWSAAALIQEGRLVALEVISGIVYEAYESGLLYLREGPILEAALQRLPERPDVLIVNATGRDHPRRAGMALHLGYRLGLPTIGVTRNPLLALGTWPGEERGASTPLRIGDETVGCWLRTRCGGPPLAVHAAWRTDPDTAAEVVMGATVRWRVPEPLRQARRAARMARAGSSHCEQAT